MRGVIVFAPPPITTNRCPQKQTLWREKRLMGLTNETQEDGVILFAKKLKTRSLPNKRD